MKYIKIYLVAMLGLVLISAAYLPFNDTEARSVNKEINIITNPETSFLNVENLAPGDTIIDTINVENKGNVDFAYIIDSIKASGDAALFESLQLKITKAGIPYYEGKLAELKNVQLGKLLTFSNEDLDFSISLPLEADNALQKKTSIVDFIFSAKELFVGEADAVLPNTATSVYNLLLVGTLFTLAGFIIIYFLKRNRSF